ncbi:MAG TPA: AI-2E family transporter [Actinomycetota bacterium]|nr:AI-2E family transporter [Actinomycetota bacterium]
MTETGTAPSDATPAPPEEPGIDGWRRRWPPMSYWVRVLLTIAAVSAVLVALWSVINIVILVLMAAVLAIGLDPAVRFIERRGRSRGRAVTLIFLAVLAILIMFAWLVIPPLVTQVGELADDIPGYVERLSRRDDALGRYFQENDVADKLQKFVEDLPKQITNSFGTIVGVAGKVGSQIFNVLTVTILTIYFMLSLPRMRRTAAIWFAPGMRDRAEAVMDQATSRIGAYVAGILTTASIAGTSALVFFSILGLIGLGIPFAVPLAVFSGLLGLIPAVGAYIGAAPAVIVGYFQSPLTGVLILIYFIVYQQVENYVIQPRIMKNAVNLSPVAVVISTLVFGSLAGFAGAVLALPAAATIKVILVELFLRDRVAEGDEAAQETLEEHERAEAEAEEDAKARARARKRMISRLQERLRPKSRG